MSLQLSQSDSPQPQILDEVFAEVHRLIAKSDLCYAPVVNTHTDGDTTVSYLTEPGLAILSMPSVDINVMDAFLDGFDDEYEFDRYLDDPVKISPSEQLCKTAGQLCYFSFGPKRTNNANAWKYFDHIIDSGHHSVLEHANYSFLFYGISRSLTHELVRHRVGMSYSQVSQRYVDGRILRFVERPEYYDDELLHCMFLQRIVRAYRDYHDLADMLMRRQAAGSELLSDELKTGLRKKVNQAARSSLPNETEAPIVVTGNIRAWRHFIDLRASAGAEIEIRKLAVMVYDMLSQRCPLLFHDYEKIKLPDGTFGVSRSST